MKFIGRIWTERSVFDREQLAEIFVQDIRKLQAHGPYQFCALFDLCLVAY